MEKIFQELMSVKDVYGVWLIDAAGRVRYRKTGGPAAGGEPTDWLPFLNALAGIREADLLCEKRRIYIRKAGDDCLIVMMGLAASPAMVRLNCDLLLPLLKDQGGARGLRSFFKRRTAGR